MLRKSLRSLLLLAGAPALFLACSGDDDETPIEPTPEAALIIDRATADYGEVEVGQPSFEQVFTVRNASPTAVKEVKVVLDNPVFVITANTCERFLDAGRECQVRVRFAPTLAGTFVTRLRVQGAPEVDHATLSGNAFAMLDVRVQAANARVVVGADEHTCRTECRIPIRTPEVKLMAAPTGFPTWGGACSTATMACVVRMDGAKTVSLVAVAPVVQWEQGWSRHPRNVAVAPGGDIFVEDGESVTRLSGNGQVLWTRSVSYSRDMAVDGSGNAYVLNYVGRVTRYGPLGTELWSYLPEGATVSGQRLAVAPDGSVYFVVLAGTYDTATQLRLLALDTQGALRWDHTFNDSQFNYLQGLGVDSAGAVYLSGNALRREGTSTPPVLISEKRYFRKFSAEGAQVWENTDSWYDFVVSSGGMTSAISPTVGTVPGGFYSWLIDGNAGVQRPAPPGPVGPGVARTQAFTADGKLLVGGYQETSTDVSNSTPGKGWFALMNPETRALGPVTYLDPSEQGGVHVTGLSLLPSGNVVVGGGYGPSYGAGPGFIRVYDARVLTTDFTAR